MNEEAEEVILQALGHEVRRDILRTIEASRNGTSYTDLMDRLKLPTGKLNYHLKQLDGLVEKNEEVEYVLTPLGRRGLGLLSSISRDLDQGYRKFVKVAYRAQRRSLQPLIRWFVYIVLIGDSVAFVMTGSLAYLAYAEGGPALAKILLPLLLPMGIALFVWLTYVLLTVPECVKRFERRVFELR